jgi:hypothetical protein
MRATWINWGCALILIAGLALIEPPTDRAIRGVLIIPHPVKWGGGVEVVELGSYPRPMTTNPQSMIGMLRRDAFWYEWLADVTPNERAEITFRLVKVKHNHRLVDGVEIQVPRDQHDLIHRIHAGAQARFNAWREADIARVRGRLQGRLEEKSQALTQLEKSADGSENAPREINLERQLVAKIERSLLDWESSWNPPPPLPFELSCEGSHP